MKKLLSFTVFLLLTAVNLLSYEYGAFNNGLYKKNNEIDSIVSVGFYGNYSYIDFVSSEIILNLGYEAKLSRYFSSFINIEYFSGLIYDEDSYYSANADDQYEKPTALSGNLELRYYILGTSPTGFFISGGIGAFVLEDILLGKGGIGLGYKVLIKNFSLELDIATDCIPFVMEDNIIVYTKYGLLVGYVF